MSDILEKFNIFSKISGKLKRKIKFFHIFNDNKGRNVLFVTKEDQVFAFGSNSLCQCGFGHNMRIEKPQEIPELFGKQIRQFSIGYNYVLALNQQKQVYVWGYKCKPEINPHLNNIIEISCGSRHCSALDSRGKVFCWGNNKWGQVGCGKEYGTKITRPFHLKSLKNIKTVQCFGWKSFALTNDGLVYSWGENYKYCLGHESRNDIFEPQLISALNTIISVGCSVNNTYFLTNERKVYFCGEIDCKSHEYQKIPKLLKTDLRFESFQSSYTGLTLNQESIYCLERNTIMKFTYKSYFDFYLNIYQTTVNTIEINGNELNFSDRFQQISNLGSGGFGQVIKVKDKCFNSISAVKIIELDQNDIKFNKFIKEVKIMSKCSEDYVVKYFGSKIENNFLYILMESFDDNLENIIKNKNNCFNRKQSEEMSLTEYFISSELSKELIECVEYLHELEPPIIHRDLKPANILVNYNPNKGRFLKLCDFGLATYGSDQTISHTRGIGSIKYMAPEVTDGLIGKNDLRVKYSTKADIYSLGKIICDLFDFSIYSSNKILTSNKKLKNNWIDLEKLIRKMIDSLYEQRPGCTQILIESNSWLIKKNKLTVNYDLVDKYRNQFFKSYMRFKLIEKVNSNIAEPNWLVKFKNLIAFQ